MTICGCPLHRQSHTNEVWTKLVDVGNWELGGDQECSSERDKALLTSKCASPQHNLTTSNIRVESQS